MRYNDHWLWIANNDWRSKRALSVLMFFFTLTESGGGAEATLDPDPGPVAKEQYRTAALSHVGNS